MKGVNKLSSFTIKIIAMITMTFDHIGVVFASFWGISANEPFYLVCRYIGRFALPLYCFLLVEAVINTKHYKKYNIKLGVMALIISTALCICQFVPNLGLESVTSAGNIFLDLLLGSMLIYCLKHENKGIKALAVIPIAISILSFTAKAIETSESCSGCAYKLTVLWYPAFLRLQYDWLSIALILGYFLSYEASKLYYKVRETNTGIEYETMRGTPEWRITTNLFSALFTIVISFAYYIISYINNDIVFWRPEIQLFAIASIFIIIFYSGNRGYNAKWFNNFAYLYYIMHIAVIFGVCYLIYIL